MNDLGIFPEERPAQMSQRPNWEVVRLLGIFRYALNGEIPWYAERAKDISYLKGFDVYYI